MAVGSIVADSTRDESPLVLACSPRAGGNSDLAADMLVRGLENAGASPRVARLHEHQLQVCLGCQACSVRPGHACPLMARDDTEELYGRIIRASMLFFAAPIYFYHLPGPFKGFIDRAQRYYQARAAGDAVLSALAPRRAHICLLAGRKKGERLFEGSLLTMRYFLWPFNAVVAEPLCLTGYDDAGDMARDDGAKARVARYAFDAWKGARP